jgi:hypothetical protein
VQATREPRGWFLVALVVVAGIAAAPAAAFLLGDQSEPNTGEADRAVHPIELSTTASRAIGMASLVVAVAATVFVIWRTRSRASTDSWTLAVLAFVAAGVFVGLAYGVGTAKTTGANIGFGLVMFLAIPGVPAALLFGIIAMVRGWRKDRQLAPLPSM